MSRLQITPTSSRATSSKPSSTRTVAPRALLEDDADVGVLTLELRIDESHSLKDKRHIVKGLKDRLRHKFNVAVAEIDYQDLWQRALIAAVTVSSATYARGKRPAVAWSTRPQPWWARCSSPVTWSGSNKLWTLADLNACPKPFAKNWKNSINYEITDPRIDVIGVAEVLITPDGKHARSAVESHGDGAWQEHKPGRPGACQGFIQKELATGSISSAFPICASRQPSSPEAPERVGQLLKRVRRGRPRDDGV